MQANRNRRGNRNVSRNGRANGQEERRYKSAEDHQQTERGTGLIAELLVLKVPGKDNNYAEFKEQMSTYLQQKFGNNGTFISRDEYYEPPEVIEPDADDGPNAGRADRALWALYESEIKARAKLMNKHYQERTQMYQILWGQLSNDSKEKIRQNHRFAAAEYDEDGSPDPLQLWRIISQTHLVESTGNILLDREEAKMTYSKIKQRYTESLGDYKLRFDRSIEAMVQLEHPELPNANSQVIHFIKSLNDSKHHEWKVKTINEIASGIEPPESVVEAYEACSNYKPILSDITYNQRGTTFLAGTRGRDSGRGHRDRKFSANGRRNDNTLNDNDETKDEGVDCYRCGRRGHYATDCTFNGKCNNCGKTGHKASVCRSKSARSRTTALTKRVFLTEDDRDVQCEDNFEVHCDNQSNENVFCNACLLTNLHTADNPVTIGGINGEEFECNEVGDFMGFEVFYSPKAIANILSWKKMTQSMELKWDQNRDEFVAIRGNKEKLVFKCNGDGLYTCNVKKGLTLITTVSNNEADYSTREVKAAQNARTLSRRLGYATPRDLIKMINNGALLNCPVTTADVLRAEKIYGKDIAALKGKTTRRSSTPISEGEKLAVQVRVNQDLHIDIMFIDGLPFMLSKSKPLELLQVTDLRGKRTAAALQRAFDEHINNYKNAGYTVVRVFTDGETGIEAIKDHIKSKAEYNPVGPEQHVPVIERAVRLVKERVRSILCGLPYTLPSSYLTYLVSYAVRVINMVPGRQSTDNLSPREKLRGRKLDFKRDLRIEFGQYVQAKTPNKISNSSHERTEGCIALFPRDTATGSVEFLNLATQQVVTRDQWTELPTPDVVIRRMNELAIEQKRKLSKDPVFSIGGRIVAAEDDDDEVDAPVPGEPVVTIEIEDDDDMEDIINEEAVAEAEAVVNLSGEDTIDEEADHRGEVTIDNDAEIPDVIQPSNVYDDDYGIAANVDEDGDIIMDDADAIFDDTPLPEAVRTSTPSLEAESQNDNEQQHQHYNLREKRSNWRSRVFMTAMKKFNESNIKYTYHTSIKQCIKKVGPRVTNEAVKKELSQMLSKGVWEPVHSKDLTNEERSSIITSRLFLKEKYKANGEFEKLKARLVAGGHQQDRTVYEKKETSSPTIATSSVMMIAAIAAEEKREVVTMDIGGAYLHAEMKKDVYMRLPKELSDVLVRLDGSYKKYVNSAGQIVVKLLKALYGCVESAKLWYEHFRACIEKIGFTANPKDICVFNKSVKGKQCTIGVHVDDQMITCSSSDLLTSTIANIKSMFSETTETYGKIHNYLGMTMDFSSSGLVKVTMKKYLEEKLKEFNVTGNSKTPSSSNLFEINDKSKSLSKNEQEIFHTKVASILFLGKRVRPDTLLTVSFLASRVNSPTEEDNRKLDKLLRYLNSTKHFCLTLDGKSINSPWLSVDAAFGVHQDGKGHTGMSEGIGIGGFNHKSSKQRIICKSSTESEIVAASDSISNAMHTREFLKNQGYNLGPTIVYQDNLSAIKMMEDGRGSSDRTKHISVRYFWMKEKVDNGEIKFQYIPTENMVSDVLTKPISGKQFFKLRNQLLNWRGETEEP